MHLTLTDDNSNYSVSTSLEINGDEFNVQTMFHDIDITIKDNVVSVFKTDDYDETEGYFEDDAIFQWKIEKGLALFVFMLREILSNNQVSSVKNLVSDFLERNRVIEWSKL